MGGNSRTGKLLRAWKEADDTEKTMTGAALSFGTAILFSVYNGYLGIRLLSVWYGSICVFYLLLTAIRGSILLTEKKNRNLPETERFFRRRKTFRISSVLLLLLILSLLLPVAMMAVFAKPVKMGRIPAISMAVYTTYKIAMASVQIRRQKRRSGTSILAAELRAVNLIDALVSVLALQNTLIMVNGAPRDVKDMIYLTVVSSAVIYALMAGVSIYLLREGNRKT